MGGGDMGAQSWPAPTATLPTSCVWPRGWGKGRAGGVEAWLLCPWRGLSGQGEQAGEAWPSHLPVVRPWPSPCPVGACLLKVLLQMKGSEPAGMEGFKLQRPQAPSHAG